MTATLPNGVPHALDLTRVLGSSSHPALFECSDDQQYVVKSISLGCRLATELVVSRLGVAIGAPVAHVEPVMVDPDLIDDRLLAVAFEPGLGSGSRFIGDCHDADGVAFCQVPDNYNRYLDLAVLYGWTAGLDHQFIYSNRGDLVYSVDHGYFLDDFYRYAEHEYTSALETTARLDGIISRHFPFTPHQIRSATEKLEMVDAADIRLFVDEVPAEWGLTAWNRRCLNRYLLGRRDVMLRKVRDLEEGLTR